jgi:hypothetical protein
MLSNGCYEVSRLEREKGRAHEDGLVDSQVSVRQAKLGMARSTDTLSVNSFGQQSHGDQTLPDITRQPILRS